jgi:hypothetical protein
MRTTTAALMAGLLAGCAGEPAAPERPRAERQLEELYRPLLALVVESRESVTGFLKVLGRDWIHPNEGELQGRERELWLEKAEKDLMPRNDRMCALVRAKRDLVDGPLPETWQALLDHQDRWKADHAQWKKDGKPYGLRARNPFPRYLEAELRKDIERLEASLK